MKKYKVILAAFVIISIVSCHSYKFVFAPTDGVIATKTFSKILKEDQLFLVFTKAYDNSKITVYENKIVLFDSIIPPPRKNITKVFKVNINSNITIHFDDIKKPLHITKEQMKNYKFIYIEKDNKKVTVDFNNGTKNYDGKFILD